MNTDLIYTDGTTCASTCPNFFEGNTCSDTCDYTNNNFSFKLNTGKTAIDPLCEASNGTKFYKFTESSKDYYVNADDCSDLKGKTVAYQPSMSHAIPADLNIWDKDAAECISEASGCITANKIAYSPDTTGNGGSAAIQICVDNCNTLGLASAENSNEDLTTYFVHTWDSNSAARTGKNPTGTCKRLVDCTTNSYTKNDDGLVICNTNSTGCEQDAFNFQNAASKINDPNGTSIPHPVCTSSCNVDGASAGQGKWYWNDEIAEDFKICSGEAACLGIAGHTYDGTETNECASPCAFAYNYDAGQPNNNRFACTLTCTGANSFIVLDD
jgi:hypothetical protein